MINSPTVGENKMDGLLTKELPIINREAAIVLVTDGLNSPQSVRAYIRAIEGLADYLDEWGAPFNKATVNRYRTLMLEQGMGTSTINLRLSAIRKLAFEMADNNALDHRIATGIRNIKNVKQQGRRTGNWLSKEQVQELLSLPDDSLVGKRDKAVLALLVSTGLRRAECASLTVDHLQKRDGRPALVDIVGKGNKFRTIPAIQWAFDAVYEWLTAAGIKDGPVIRGFWKGGHRIRRTAISCQGMRDIVIQYSTIMGVAFAPHDLRRTFAQLAYKGGADLKQLQMSLGHADIKTTERYLGLVQDFENAPVDFIGVSV
jgi:site-specific recombinase XerD